MTSLLEIKNLKTYFITEEEEVPAVDGVSFSIKEGETLCVVGESGSGKSITSISILQLVPETHGKIIDVEIVYKGTNLVDLSENEIRKIRGNDISMIFQEPMTSLNPVFTVGDQITESLMLHEKLSKEAALKKAVELLNLVGIPVPEKRVSEYPHQLSGGMRQRVMIAMALACNPVLLITHDLGVVAETADNVAVMYLGRIVEYADGDTFFENPKHPYSQGLLKSIPDMEKDEHRLHPIVGQVPKPTDVKQGCRFASRCPFATDLCREEEPPFFTEGKQQVKCWMYSDRWEKEAKVGGNEE